MSEDGEVRLWKYLFDIKQSALAKGKENNKIDGKTWIRE